jgi:isopentenyl-diphosphate Delta-isomerase
MDRTVTLCDESGTTLGECPIVEAHTGGGKLHLAFSAYIFAKDRRKLLIHRRAKDKMLWPEKWWTNTCCSHPFPGETPRQAGERRLKEELGIECVLSAGPSFVYRAEEPEGRGVEREYVTTLYGGMEETAPLKPAPTEILEWKWALTHDLLADFKWHPENYTPWFILGLPKVLSV